MNRRSLDIAIYTALRIACGGMLSCHGMQKLLGVLGKVAQPVGSQLWIGGTIELVGGLLVAVGFATRIAAFVVSGMMAVAYFQFHWKLALGTRVLPIVNGGELAVVYCFAFLLFWARGAGPISIDGKLGEGAPLP